MGFIPSGALQDGSVTTPKLADAAVSTAKIADAAVSAAKLGTGAVAYKKIADITLGADNNLIDTGTISTNWRAYKFILFVPNVDAADEIYMKINNNASAIFAWIVSGGPTPASSATSVYAAHLGTSNTPGGFFAVGEIYNDSAGYTHLTGNSGRFTSLLVSNFYGGGNLAAQLSSIQFYNGGGGTNKFKTGSRLLVYGVQG